jgi:hypothetical protein
VLNCAESSAGASAAVKAKILYLTEDWSENDKLRLKTYQRDEGNTNQDVKKLQDFWELLANEVERRRAKGERWRATGERREGYP